MHSFLHGGGSEVQQQADRQVEQAEIGQNLFGMDWSEILDRKKFNRSSREVQDTHEKFKTPIIPPRRPDVNSVVAPVARLRTAEDEVYGCRLFSVDAASCRVRTSARAHRCGCLIFIPTRLEASSTGTTVHHVVRPRLSRRDAALVRAVAVEIPIAQGIERRYLEVVRIDLLDARLADVGL